MTADPDPGTRVAYRVVPANTVSWSQLKAVLGDRGDSGTCGCQWFKLANAAWEATSVAEREERMREQTRCGHPRSRTTSGLVAFADDEPVGWVAVEPRTAYPRLRSVRAVWSDRDEDPDDDGVWSVTCFVVRKGWRRRGVGHALAAATPGFARSRGGRTLEGYPRLAGPDGRSVGDAYYVGTLGAFAAAGFVEVSRPTDRRAVMRMEL